MEFVPAGNLEQAIALWCANNTSLSEKVCAVMLLGLVKTMRRLWFEHKLLHLDLKPANLLLAFKTACSKIPYLKVGDPLVIFLC